MNEHILIVEDEKKIALLLKDYLESNGYRASHIDSGDKVIGFIKSNSIDLILLDIMLPGVDGISLCRSIRGFSNIPIIFATAKVEEIDALLGLEMGADDYIRKPFRPREVVARVKAVLRRVNGPPMDSAKKVGALSLREEERLIMINDTLLELTPNEFGILKAFIYLPDKVFSRAELVEKVQGYSFDGYERTIDTHIKNIRKKLDRLLPGREIIKAVYGVGYRLDRSSLF